MMVTDKQFLDMAGLRTALLGGAALALVAACGGGESSSEAPSKPMPAKAAETEETAPPAPPAAEAEFEEVAEAASSEAESLVDSASAAVEETALAAEEMVDDAVDTASSMADDAQAVAEDMADDAAAKVDDVVASFTGDVAKGKRVFTKCMSCHSIKEGQNRVGPSLYGIIGREAGTVAKFNYSDANKNSGITWTPEILLDYLEDPQGYIPGTRMVFPGLKSEEDRQNVIAYLQEEAK